MDHAHIDGKITDTSSDIPICDTLATRLINIKMQTILLSKWDEIYLEKCADAAKVAFGIIIGHQTESNKFIVVHLAKNREEDIDGEGETGEDPISGSTQGVHRVEEIDTQTLANQWFCAIKMIPGAFSVLGIFVSAVEESILEETTFKAAKHLLFDINNILQGRAFCSSSDVHGSYLFLVHSSKANETVCKSYTHSTNGGSFTPMECRFVEKPFKWLSIDCNYELDEVLPIMENAPKINIEKQFQASIEIMQASLAASEILLQNEPVDNSLTLDAYIKQKNKSNIAPQKNQQQQQQQIHQKQHHDQQQQNPIEFLNASILVPIISSESSTSDGGELFEYRRFNDVIRFSGIITSRIYCNHQNTMADVKRFIRDDIMRSMTARIQVFCDGLTSPNITNTDVFFCEPPRRVYFNLPSCNSSSPILFSDYLFRGEAATVACSQAKQILDLFIESENIIDDFEGLPDIESFKEPTPQTPVLENGTKNANNTKTWYIVGIVVTLLILLLAVVLKIVIEP